MLWLAASAARSSLAPTVCVATVPQDAVPGVGGPQCDVQGRRHCRTRSVGWPADELEGCEAGRVHSTSCCEGIGENAEGCRWDGAVREGPDRGQRLFEAQSATLFLDFYFRGSRCGSVLLESNKRESGWSLMLSEMVHVLHPLRRTPRRVFWSGERLDVRTRHLEHPSSCRRSTTI